MHFKFWGQSLNKGTWLTAAAKDTNYFHQTVVITIKSCLSISSSSPETSTACISKVILHFKASKRSWILSLPFLCRKREGGSLWECFYFKLFSALLQCHWNMKTLKQKCESSLPGLLQESLFHKDVLCVHENLWRLKINARCLLQSLSTLFMYLLARLIA